MKFSQRFRKHLREVSIEKRAVKKSLSMHDKDRLLHCQLLLEKVNGIAFHHILFGKTVDSIPEEYRQYEFDLDKNSPTYRKLKLFIKDPNHFFSYCTKTIHHGRWQVIVFELMELLKLSNEELYIIWVDFD